GREGAMPPPWFSTVAAGRGRPPARQRFPLSPSCSRVWGRERIGCNRRRRGRLPRLFTGLEVPPQVGFLLSLKRGGLSGARWIEPENYHITLRFIGDVDHVTANEVVDGLD